MMLIQYRLMKHEEEAEKAILEETLKQLELDKYRNILDSRDPSDISDAMKEIANTITTTEPEFGENGQHAIFKGKIVELVDELRQDILLLDFVFEYLQDFEDDFDLALDNDTYSDFIAQFRAYLEADKVTDIPSPGMQSIETAFQDASNARSLGINQISLGDLVIERLGTTGVAQGVQVFTPTYIPAGTTPILKGFGGAPKRKRGHTMKRLRRRP